MKTILLLLTFINFSSLVNANECSFETKKSYFQNLDGEVKLLPKTKSFKTIYLRYKKFVPDYPINSALKIPFSGSCKKLNIIDVKVFSALGPREMPGSKGEHSEHWMDSKFFSKFDWDEKPLFSGKKKIEMEENLASIETFRINDLANTAPKGQHIWRYKFVIKLKSSNGKIETLEKIVNSPLIH